MTVLRHYFAEEVKESWVFVLAAVLAIASGAWLWKTQSAFKHALWPLAAVAIIQLTAGGAVLLRTPQQLSVLERDLIEAPVQLKATETHRVVKMLDAFRIYKLLEIGLLLTAIGLALFLSQHPIARGVAVGLLLQSALMLAAGLVAEHRAEVYLDALHRL